MKIIKKDLKLLGISHDNFFSETEIVNKDLVKKAIKKLEENKFVVEGFLQPPKGENSDNWKKIKRLIFKSTLFGDDTDRALQKVMDHGHISQMILLIIWIKLIEIMKIL